jgi:hypothetical protein
MDITTRVFESEEQHQEWLAWLKTEDLRGANLIGANLIGANLRGANLIGANLRGANLTGANLIGANLSGADLYRANLSDADLYRADLYGADLYGADLSGADLSGADLYGADLSDSNLRGADLSGANFEGAKINWQSHALLSELLRQKAQTDTQRILATLIGQWTHFCWQEWMAGSPIADGDLSRQIIGYNRAWALGVLGEHLQEGEGKPW